MGLDVTLVGHPYSPIGMGEHVRCVHRSFKRAGVTPRLVDIYGLNKPDQRLAAEFASCESSALSEVNVFHINGDEVEQALSHLRGRGMVGPNGYNIVYPAWELTRYPADWARQLDRFDEIWAPSRFVQQAIAKAVKRPVLHMPLSTGVWLSSFLGRRYFGIPESDYVFLFFFDTRSYISRKNPSGVLDAFAGLLRERSSACVRLVIKYHSEGPRDSVLAALVERYDAPIRSRIMLLNRVMTDNEVKNLVRCSDCFVSLHRSEGYGRGLAEAMCLGKPVIGTAYSGNLDFMEEGNSLLVRHTLVPVPDGAYPHAQGQHWAEPDICDATEKMIWLVDDPSRGRELGLRGQHQLQRNFSYNVIGLRYRRRIEEIREQLFHAYDAQQRDTNRVLTEVSSSVGKCSDEGM